ncbi:hypothetical protein OROGR_004620 [Orobanche gracilis]
MAEIDDNSDGVVCPASHGRWKALNYLTELLSEGKVQLEDLVKQAENPNPLDHGFLNKRKRSPRKNSIFMKPRQSHVPVLTHPTNSRTGLIKITFKKPTYDKPPPAAGESLERNPNIILARKRKKGSVIGSGSDIGSGSGSGSSPSRNNKKFRMMRIPSSTSEPVLPETFKNRIVEIGGRLESLVFVIEKDLFSTDVSPSHARLSVPYRQVKNTFLSSYEEAELASERGIPVAVVQPCLEECSMTFKSWKKNSMYVLINGWNNVCRENRLTARTLIRLWSFRRNSELCFVLVKIVGRNYAEGIVSD